MQVSDLLGTLASGFHAENLDRIGGLCEQCAEFDRYPAAFLLIEYVCNSLAQQWEDSPLETSVFEEAQRRLSPCVERVLRSIASGDDKEVVEATDRLAKEYASWRTQ